MAGAETGERDLARCFGKHRQQTVEYALKNCLQCRKLKSCVRKTWGTDRQRRWDRDDWWELRPAAAPPTRRPPWPSAPPAKQ